MRTYHGLICEDQPRELEFIRKELEKMFQERHVPITFACFDKSKKCLEYIENRREVCDVFFVDIEMPGYSGLELCRSLRAADQDSLIIFISNREEMVFQTFEVQPFRFIRKSRFSGEAEHMVDAVIAELEEREGIMLSVKELHSDRVYAWNIHQIFYIESLGKTCRVATENGAAALQYRLKDFEEKVADWGFLKPHRSYLVNYRKIRMIEKSEIILDNGERIPLSRYQAETIREQYIHLVNGG